MKRILLVALTIVFILACTTTAESSMPILNLYSNCGDEVFYGDTVTLFASVKNVDSYYVFWEVNRGNGWESLNTWGSTYSFVVCEGEENYEYRFKVVDYTNFKIQAYLEVESENETTTVSNSDNGQQGFMTVEREFFADVITEDVTMYE